MLQIGEDLYSHFTEILPRASLGRSQKLIDEVRKHTEPIYKAIIVEK